MIIPTYPTLLTNLKSRIQASRTRATLAVNAELIHLYWDIGNHIAETQVEEGWGSKILNKLAQDLKESFPDMKGFSPTNLKYMRIFALSCPQKAIGQQVADQLPWFHIVALLTKVKNEDKREWYAYAAVENGWSRSTLIANIRDQLYDRQGKAITNFAVRLPLQASVAQAALKDPYFFDFLGLGNEAHERDIENALVHHITHFLLELGRGFAFIARQHRIEVGGDEFFLDLLFYHTRLKCYVVVELKATEFKPEHAGQLNFYLSAVDKTVKGPDDNQTIGILLCKTKNSVVAEYALSGISKPIGVAEYQLVRSLPEELSTSLPTVADLEAEFTDTAPEDA
jgi:predicted nuclease of restriction endonuclease-like (RecB) superfamily